MKRIFSKIIDLIYPPICSICGKVSTKTLCNKCKNKLKDEFVWNVDNYNNDKDKYFSEHYYFFKYKNIIREQILGLKFQDKPYNQQTITYFFKNMEKSFEKLKKYDIMIVVPISKARKKERGYNQSQLIAKQVSQIINIPIMKNILEKSKDTVPQSTLNKVQRQENTKGAYKVKKDNYKKIKNKNILLVDDIYTTGSTINECAKVLQEVGIAKKQIGALTLAKD